MAKRKGSDLGKKIKEGDTKRARFEKKRVESRGRFLEDTLVSARLEQQWDEIMSGGCNRSTITTSFLCVFTHYVLAVLFRPIPK